MVDVFKICISMAAMITPEMPGWIIGDNISDKLQKKMLKFEIVGKFQQLENAINKELDGDNELKNIITEMAKRIYTDKEEKLDKKGKMKRQNGMLLAIAEGVRWDEFCKKLEEYVLDENQRRKAEVLFRAVAKVYKEKLTNEHEKTRDLIFEFYEKTNAKLDGIMNKIEEMPVRIVDEMESRGLVVPSDKKKDDESEFGNG